MNTISSGQEPIAIIGMGCRLPGNAADPSKFWKILCEAKDLITDVPKERWDFRRFYDPDVQFPGKMYVNQGGFLSEKWEEFDADFFQISPREASYLDPQLRLLLELAWETIEDGGLLPENLRGSDTAVYIGAFTSDWQTLQNSPFNRDLCGNYSGINGSKTILSARISHFLDLKGACLTVDTACSSSLVAVHLACENLLQRKCSLAIAGGVNAMLVPETSIAMAKGRFLNPEGRCRSFDADAKGYVRGEGGGMVVLKRLSDALLDGDTIHALIRGTGINQDGYTPGIAQPNVQAQIDLIQSVLKQSAVSPASIHYVEAHGTGTPIGDPIEAMALDQVLHVPDRKGSCYLGAVKTLFGHLEAAAGIAGLIKAVLCLKKKKIPPNLHFQRANPNIPFEKYCLLIPQDTIDVPEMEFACVNAFGYGGTNAHAVLQHYPTKETSPSINNCLLFPFSAKNKRALQDLVVQYENFLREDPKINLVDLAYTLSHKRHPFPERMTINACSHHELGDKLHLISKGELPEGCYRGRVLEGKSQLTFVYTGMGPQWWGMGRDLLENQAVFRETMQRCDRYLQSVAGWSLLEELQRSEEHSRMEDPVLAQTSNYALQVALTELFTSCGVVPDVYVGHSIGEIAAAYAAGALTLEEGLLVAYHRARIQSKRKGMGGMLAIGIGRKELLAILPQYQDKVSIAAENSDRALTLSGEMAELNKIAETLEKHNVFNRFLKVNIAYHSHQMDGLEKELLESLSQLKSRKPKGKLFSTVFADLQERELHADYWWQNIRQPVLFAQTIQNMISQDCRLFVEIGPHPVLGNYIKELLGQLEINGQVIPSLNRKKRDSDSFWECLGGLFVNGHTLFWERWQRRGQTISLPTYPWQKKPYWVESEESQQYRLSASQHVMLSRRIPAPIPTWQVELNQHFFPWLQHHKIEGNIVFPASGYVEAALALHGSVPCEITDLHFMKPLAISPDQNQFLRLALDPEKNCFYLHGLLESEEKVWTLHASGKCSSNLSIGSPEKVDLVKLDSAVAYDLASIYAGFDEQGLNYGTSFRRMIKIWKGKGEALAEIEGQNPSESYHLHPAVLDAAFQSLIGTMGDCQLEQSLILPSQIERLVFYKSPGESLFCHAKRTKLTPELLVGDLSLCDASGEVFVQIKGLKCRILNKKNNHDEKLLYRSYWMEKPLKQVTKKGAPYRITSPQFLQSQEQAEELLKSLKEEAILLDFAMQEKDLGCFEKQTVQACVHLVKAIGERPFTIWVVTHGCQPVDEATIEMAGASLWGLCRVIRQEYPNICCHCIDMDAESSLILEEVDEIAWRKGKRYVHKFSRNDLSEMKLSPISSFALDQKKPGILESLYFNEMACPSPGSSEVVIQVHSASLNFKDLMKVLGLLNQVALEGTYFGKSFGMECSGTIISVGPKVKKYKVGDRVCAFLPNTFRSHLVVSEKYITPIPWGTDLEQAPIYVGFITTLRALKELAKLKKGETVLIHSATGAVGLAAIQYAQHVGARVIATAGSEEKRQYLRKLGVEHCADSRSLSFADQVMQVTNGRGVDVILNSLAGDALLKSWSLLAPYGRFIEIGKRDIAQNSSLPMQMFNGNTSFAAIDLDRTFVDDPKCIQRLVKETFALFQKGIFRPLPYTTFSASQIQDAFQFMARAKQIGKVMVNFSEQRVQGVPLKVHVPIVRENSSYLITGGFSGFGLEVAKWLVGKGAKSLILVGRSGASSDAAQEAIQQMMQEGVSVKVAAVDITDYKQLSKLLQECKKNHPPIKGMIHSAMVLEDSLIANMTDHSIDRVLSPKVVGCLNLHLLSAKCDLDYFVLFSSISSLLGNPGQGNYAAANAFLDSFCHYRRGLGLPALTINWGALNMGILSRNQQVAKHLENQGIRAISPKQALQVLEKAIHQRATQLSAIDVNWAKLLKAFPQDEQNSPFSDFQGQSVLTSHLTDEWQHLDEKQREQLLIEKIREMIAKTIKMPVADLGVQTRLHTLGVDSLMAMELQSMMEDKLGVKVPSLELMKGPTIEQLAKLSNKMLG